MVNRGVASLVKAASRHDAYDTCREFVVLLRGVQCAGQQALNQAWERSPTIAMCEALFQGSNQQLMRTSRR